MNPITPIDDFAPGGQLELSLPGFEPRQAQADLAAAIGHAMDEGEVLLAEAGTGVGKSLAYLMPGLRRAIEKGTSLLISTATLNLQSQLLEKDIPLAMRALGLDPKDTADLAVRAMGRSNYFCKLRFELVRDPRSAELFDAVAPSTLKKLETWSRAEPTTVKDRLPFPVEPEIWEKVNVDAYGCLGQACPHARDCWFLKDRERLRRARLVVANHALLLSDVSARRERSAVLPDCDTVIFDEAHHLERMASEHLGIRLAHWDLEQALDPVLDAKSGKGLAPRIGFPAGLAEQVSSARLNGVSLFEEAHVKMSSLPRGQSLEATPEMLHDTVSTPLLDAAGILKKAVETLSDEALGAELKAAAQRLERVADQVKRWCRQDDVTHVYWMEPQGRKGEVVLRSAPLKAGEALADELYPRFSSLIFVSATLATHQGMGFTRQRLGLPEDTRSLMLGSPFDYRKQVELHLSRLIPDPKADEGAYFDALEKAMGAALVKSQGRAFVLFTSFRHLEEMAGRMEAFIEAKGWLFLKQDGRTPKEKLLSRFKDHGAAVLFGAASFWEGVDVPGEALSSVILCRLPFAVPDTPLEKARAKQVEAEGKSGFKELSLPEAVLRLKQGFGRLIRHSEDRGFIYIMDSRVLSTGYGKAFIQALPACRTFVDGLEQESEA